MQIITVILAGGSGTRLAPLSLTSQGKLPKQFLALVGQKTMLQETLDRVPKGSEIIIVPETRFADVVRTQAGKNVEILSEPFGCNTAPAVGLAARYAIEKWGDLDAVLFFMPADHMMKTKAFQAYFEQATTAAFNTGKIITIGISPTRPETGYGYIKVKPQIGNAPCAVEKFVEKPSLKTAEKYIAEGNYYWNAGIFAMKIKTALTAMEKDAREIAERLSQIDFQAVDLQAEIARKYDEIKDIKQNISIDYAVMEKEAKNMLLIPADKALGWNDVGGWVSLAEYIKPDQNNNLIINYLNDKLTLTNCKNLLVITSVNGTLITTQELAPRAKDIISGINAGKVSDLIDCTKVTVENKTDTYLGVIGLQNVTISYTAGKLNITQA